MNQDQHNAHKSIVKRLCDAMYNFDPASVRAALKQSLAPSCVVHFGYPLGDCTGPDEYFECVYAKFFTAVPDLERRDYIRIGGSTDAGNDWVGCAGFYTGLLLGPWLDIPPTGHLFSMRFHEFYRFEENQIVEIQALWDIPDVMRQANAWPLAPSLGREIHTFAPASNDGLVPGPHDEARSKQSCEHVISMLEDLQKYPKDGGPEIMQLPKYWHPKMNWYGPSAIGTSRGIAGFRHWHQIPFINAMPDRGQYPDEINFHFFGDDNYVGVTGWPDMAQTISADGWLGIAPTGKKVTLRSLDFWRLEDGLIRENWVLVDLLDLYRQINVDVFARLREFNKSRNIDTIRWPLPDN